MLKRRAHLWWNFSPFLLKNRTLGVSVDIVQDGFAKWNEAWLILFLYNLCHKSAGTPFAQVRRLMSCPAPSTSRTLNKVGINWGWAEPVGSVSQFNEVWVDHTGHIVAEGGGWWGSKFQWCGSGRGERRGKEMVAAGVGKAQTGTRVFGRKSASYILIAVRWRLTAGTHFDLVLFPVCGFAFPCSPTHGKFIVSCSSITVVICTHSPASCLQTDISICQKNSLRERRKRKTCLTKGWPPQTPITP